MVDIIQNKKLLQTVRPDCRNMILKIDNTKVKVAKEINNLLLVTFRQSFKFVCLSIAETLLKPKY